jgi:heme exporter protein C
VRYLATGNIKDDLIAVECVNTGVVLGLLGIVTGMLWANYTWGSPWHGDPKQNGAAIALLVYFAYLVLRNSMDESQQRARVSNVYNIFAFAAMVPLLFILPRLTSSVHPGSGGNPGFNAYDLDSNLRIVFYPAVVGWTLLALWIATLRYRARVVEQKLNERKYA